ncbi:conserved hypothetical protein [Flavobacterium psychrophilum]|nr:conserved hypothetical protein [Flavobacterium psychrophilum]
MKIKQNGINKSQKSSTIKNKNVTMQKKILSIVMLTALTLNSCKKNSEVTKTVPDEIITSSETDNKGNKLDIDFNNTKSTATLKLNGEIIEMVLDTTMASGANYKNEHYHYTNWHNMTILEKDGKVIFEAGKEKTPSASNMSNFEGTYIYGKKEGASDWVEINIKSLKNQDSCSIVVNSKTINNKKGCEFNKLGLLKNDTIFIKTTDWKRPVTVIITKKTNKITIDAIEKQTDDRFVLNWYCSGGGSLIGDYIKK